MKEIFKDIPGYEELYQVSNLGNVKSLRFSNGYRAKILKFWLTSNGYLAVALHINGKQKTKTVHQLVAMAFLNHKPNGFKGLIINHINFNKIDNRIENIELTTQRKNANKKHIKSSSKYVGVYWSKDKNKWRTTIMLNGKSKHLGYFTDELEASKAYQKEIQKLCQI